MWRLFPASLSAALFLLASAGPACGDAFSSAADGDSLITAKHSQSISVPSNYPVDHNPAWRPELKQPDGGAGSSEDSACGTHGGVTGACWPGKGRICRDGTADSSHQCASGDLRLPADIVYDPDPEHCGGGCGGGWVYGLNPEIGWGKTIADPKINFAGRYFLFSYDAGTMCVDWAMIDLKTGEYIDAAPLFLCPEERYKTFRVMDSRGKAHECRYAIDLKPDPVRPLVTAVISLMGSWTEEFDDPDNSPCGWNICYSRRLVLRDGKFEPADPDDGGFRRTECQ